MKATHFDGERTMLGPAPDRERTESAGQPERAGSARDRAQRTLGNQRIQRLVAQRGHAVGDDLERAIEGERGGGRALDDGVRPGLESAMKADFSGVRVHDDRTSYELNRQLRARAFTTGRDVFFGEGQYRPGSSMGRELLAHELTHVLQQNDGVRRKLTVGAPGDVYEREADEVAREVVREEQLWRQPEEEEEELQAKSDDLRRQPEEEEGELQAKGDDLRRQPEDEEEPLQAKR